jgi:hypothetical protein
MYEEFEEPLRRLWQRGVREHGSSWEANVLAAIESMSGGYAALGTSGHTTIEYGSLAAQAAYLYKYAPSRAASIRDAMLDFEARIDTALLPTDGNIRIALIGGGPGSEIPGILEFMSSSGCYDDVGGVHFEIFDREAGWENVHQLIESSLDVEFDVTIGYSHFDALDPPKKGELVEYDAVTMSYVISELAKHSDVTKIRKNLAGLIGTMKKKAYLIYNDNKSYDFYRFMNSVVSNSALDQLHEFEYVGRLPYPYTKTYVKIKNSLNHFPPH